jgi:NAD(P)-dependent dehydrogenase (short-subunit alcohol dehydrogenase family)
MLLAALWSHNRVPCRRKHRISHVQVAPQLDLACQDSVARFAEAVASMPGSLDILVNNAGVGNGYRHTCAAQQRLFTKQGVGMLTQASSTCSVQHVGQQAV